MYEDTREIPRIDYIDLDTFEPEVNKKYYLITFGSFYEARYKFKILIYNTTIHVFGTSTGDRHIQLRSRWSNHTIFERKIDAIAYIGIQAFKGRTISRHPWALDKHFRFALKYFPHKMI